MTDVRPGNLKLIGRATYLMQSHINHTLSLPSWIKKYGKRTQISYAEANAILFDVIDYFKTSSHAGSEVGLSIVRALESLKHNHSITWDDAEKILQTQSLGDYLGKL